MSFAGWKKRSKKYKFLAHDFPWPTHLEEICQAAYKAGERAGRKDAEAMAENAIKLRKLITVTSVA